MKRWIVIPLLFLSACQTKEAMERQEREQIRQNARDLAETEKIYAEEMNRSAESKQARRQRMIDEASIVCRDGTAYLLGDSMESWTQGGIFAVPYIKDGVIGGCNGQKGMRISAPAETTPPPPPASTEEPQVNF